MWFKGLIKFLQGALAIIIYRWFCRHVNSLECNYSIFFCRWNVTAPGNSRKLESLFLIVHGYIQMNLIPQGSAKSINSQLPGLRKELLKKVRIPSSLGRKNIKFKRLLWRKGIRGNCCFRLILCWNHYSVPLLVQNDASVQTRTQSLFMCFGGVRED